MTPCDQIVMTDDGFVRIPGKPRTEWRDGVMYVEAETRYVRQGPIVITGCVFTDCHEGVYAGVGSEA